MKVKMPSLDFPVAGAEMEGVELGCQLDLRIRSVRIDRLAK